MRISKIVEKVTKDMIDAEFPPPDDVLDEYCRLCKRDLKAQFPGAEVIVAQEPGNRVVECSCKNECQCAGEVHYYCEGMFAEWISAAWDNM